MKMHNAGGRSGRSPRTAAIVVAFARADDRGGAGGALLVDGEGKIIKFVASVVSENSSLKLCRRHAPSPGTAEIQSAK